MKKALVPLANGVEEMEAVIIIDVLRRAGWQVTAASEAAGPIRASRGVCLLADALMQEIRPDDFDVLAIPGGAEGAAALARNDTVLNWVRAFVASNRWVGAICAGPLVLQSAGVLSGRRATCHPAIRDRLTAADVCDQRVVTDGRIITSQGPGTAMEFALVIIGAAETPYLADTVRQGLVM